MQTAAGINLPLPKVTRAVRLRCGLTAVVWRVDFAFDQPEPWPQIGIDNQGYIHAWSATGQWSETESEHGMDIIGNLVPANPQ